MLSPNTTRLLSAAKDEMFVRLTASRRRQQIVDGAGMSPGQSRSTDHRQDPCPLHTPSTSSGDRRVRNLEREPNFATHHSSWVQSPISVGPACRAGLRGHAATSDESRSKGRPRGDVERMCDPWRFALRRKSFPAKRPALPQRGSVCWCRIALATFGSYRTMAKLKQG